LCAAALRCVWLVALTPQTSNEPEPELKPEPRAQNLSSLEK
jgi:hypothetical protein